MHIAIGSLRLRSRGAHCDPELARQDRRSRLAKKIGDEDWRGRKQGGRRKEGGGRTIVIKSNKQVGKNTLNCSKPSMKMLIDWHCH